jgi:SOS-response transcriptional repressor LexA
MNWAHHIGKLQAGETIQIRPKGNSMQGKVESGQLCTVEPVRDPTSIKKGDIVLVKVHGTVYLHLVKAVQQNGVSRFLIGNNRGHDNGWVGEHSVYGRCIKVED